MVNYDSIGSAGQRSSSLASGISLNQSGSNNYAYRKWCGIRRSSWLLLFYTITYVVFLVMGGMVMRNLEEDNEKKLKAQVLALKENFLQSNPSVNRTALENLLSSTYKYLESGISCLDKDANATNWSFGQGLLFTVTVVTTVGYGHVFPLTFDGKLFVIVYAILGIPFTLIFLTATVQRLLEPTCIVLAYLFQSLGAKITPFAIRIIHLIFMIILFIILFIFVPASIFWTLEEDWTYLDGVYFVFISLTTIGLGDYIPGDQEYHKKIREVYKSAVAAYLLLGLVFMTLTATVFYDIPQLNIGTVLHQQKDIHLKKEEEEESAEENSAKKTEDSADEKTSLKKSIRNIFDRSKKQVTPK